MVFMLFDITEGKPAAGPRDAKDRIPEGFVLELKLASLVDGPACSLCVETEDDRGEPIEAQIAVLRPGVETVVSRAAAPRAISRVQRPAVRRAHPAPPRPSPPRLDGRRAVALLPSASR